MNIIRKYMMKERVYVLTINGTVNTHMYVHICNTREAKFKKMYNKLSTTHVRCLAVVVNSEGGSAASAHSIYSKIRLYADTHNIKILTFVGEKALSGGYLLATAGSTPLTRRLHLRRQLESRGQCGMHGEESRHHETIR